MDLKRLFGMFLYTAAFGFLKVKCHGPFDRGSVSLHPNCVHCYCRDRRNRPFLPISYNMMFLYWGIVNRDDKKTSPESLRVPDRVLLQSQDTGLCLSSRSGFHTPRQILLRVPNVTRFRVLRLGISGVPTFHQPRRG